MNKVCKEYISDAKKFFPVMGRKERDYLRKVSGDIEDFIETEKITTKAELVEKYHQPYEVANNYYATFFDTELIIKRIKISKHIKIFISVLIAVLLLGLSFYMYVWNTHLDVALREEIVSNHETFEDNETYDNIEKNEGGDFIEEEIIE